VRQEVIEVDVVALESVVEITWHTSGVAVHTGSVSEFGILRAIHRTGLHLGFPLCLLMRRLLALS
jgi:hypothetical protein